MGKVYSEKVKMSQVWRGDEVVPVTILKVDDSQEETFEKINEGEKVNISGVSKGKGFQGAVKRHGFSKQPASHGQKHTLRAPGSVGDTDPQRVMPGQKMPGRQGGDRITVKNLLVARVQPEKNIVMVKGAVPGPKGATIEIRIQDQDN